MSASSLAVDIHVPSEFFEVFTVNSGQPLGIRLTKDKNRVTNVDVNSALLGKVFVGDRVVAVDGNKIKNGDELRKILKKVTKPNRTITIEHGLWSFCAHICTTVERILMARIIYYLGPTKRYFRTKTTTSSPGGPSTSTRLAPSLSRRNPVQIVIKVWPTPESSSFPFDLHVRYDARERLMVAHVDPASVTAVHLRPGDIIREVNGKAVASKTMLRYYMLAAIQKEGKIQLVVESDAGGNDAYRDIVEMAPDVVNVAAKQVALLKKQPPVPKRGCLTKTPKKDRKVAIAAVERHMVRRSQRSEYSADSGRNRLGPRLVEAQVVQGSQAVGTGYQ